MPRLIHQSIVVNSTQVNPSTHDVLWATSDTWVVRASDLVGTRIQTPVLTTFETSAMKVVVLPERIQIEAADPLSTSDELDVAMQRCLEKLSSARITSLGFNFNWDLDVEIARIPEYTRGLFYKGGPLIDAAGGPNATISGTVISHALQNGWRKLEIQPVYDRADVGTPVKFLQAHINYHFSIRESATHESVKLAISQRQDARADSQRLSELF